jgi:predicted O-methyltransferase YrrM
MRLSRSAREFAKKSLHRVFVAGQKLGVDILPRHWGSPIPFIPELRRTTGWRKAYDLVGVNGAAIESQFAFVEDCCTPQLQERTRRGDIYERACEENGVPGYGPIEADFLFCFITAKKPAKIVQIGAGVSTAVTLLAAREAGFPIDLMCIDPYPTALLQRLARGGAIKLIAERAQDVALETLTDLGHNGLLFIDSSHAVRSDSEVTRLILDVLPRLAVGSQVHFHDINFPYSYSRDMLTGHFPSMETAFLHAFLANNSRYRLEASLSMLHYSDPSRLKVSLPNYNAAGNDAGLDVKSDGVGHFPSAAYMRVVA